MYKVGWSLPPWNALFVSHPDGKLPMSEFYVKHQPWLPTASSEWRTTITSFLAASLRGRSSTLAKGSPGPVLTMSKVSVLLYPRQFNAIVVTEKLCVLWGTISIIQIWFIRTNWLNILRICCFQFCAFHRLQLKYSVICWKQYYSHYSEFALHYSFVYMLYKTHTTWTKNRRWCSKLCSSSAHIFTLWSENVETEICPQTFVQAAKYTTYIYVYSGGAL